MARLRLRSHIYKNTSHNIEGYRHIVGYHYSWVYICLIVRKRYDETRINGFIRLQDMDQRKWQIMMIKTAMDERIYLSKN